MEKLTPGVRKRQQILKANQLMFLWVAGVSVVVGISLVLVVLLGQKIIYGEKVIAEKGKTVAALESNLKVIDELKDNIRVLNTNEALNSARINNRGSALQVVLDALPAEPNSAAMASSLQTQLLGGIPDVTLDSLRVTPVAGVEVSDEMSNASDDDSGENTIGFSFSVSVQKGSEAGLRDILLQLERSIRPFKLTTVSVETQGSRIAMTVTGLGYYEPEQRLELRNKVVRP